MPIFPRIQSPCPYLDRFDEILDGETCRLCRREVYDLTDMTDQGRVAFMASCNGEVCVSYRVRPSIAAAAMAVAAAFVPTAAAAEDDAIIVMGGTIHDPARAEFIEAEPAGLPELPVVYEDRKPEPPAAPEQPKGRDG